jgi:hypothetical protein
MNIIDVQADNGTCTVITSTGRFHRWPGRTVNGMQWWSYTHMGLSGPPLLVTVPATVANLEAVYDANVFASAA